MIKHWKKEIAIVGAVIAIGFGIAFSANEPQLGAGTISVSPDEYWVYINPKDELEDVVGRNQKGDIVDIISTSRGNGQYTDSKEFLIVRVQGLTPEQIQKYLASYQETENITDTVNLASRKNFIDIKQFSKSVGVIPTVINAKNFSPVEKTATTISQYQKKAKIYALMSPLRKIVDKIIPKVYAVTTNVRYVDADAEAGGNGTTNCILSCGGTAAYASLNIWEAARDDVGNLVTNDTIEEAALESNGANHTADTTAVTIDGWTTGANNYINIYTTAAARHDGKWNTSKYRMVVTDATNGVINNAEAFVRFAGLQIEVGATTTTIRRALFYNSTQSGSVGYIHDNVIRGSGTGRHAGISVEREGTHYIWNNVIYDIAGDVANGDERGINVESTTNTTIIAYIYNNTIVDSEFGMVNSGGVGTETLTAVNNIVKGSGNANAYVGTFTSSDYNATDGTDTGDGGANSHTSHTFTFVDEAGNDFHLASTDVGAKDLGTSDPGSGLFSDDIDGVARSGSWDIGADEYVAAGGAVINNFCNQGTCIQINDQ